MLRSNEKKKKLQRKDCRPSFDIVQCKLVKPGTQPLVVKKKLGAINIFATPKKYHFTT